MSSIPPSRGDRNGPGTARWAAAARGCHAPSDTGAGEESLLDTTYGALLDRREGPHGLRPSLPRNWRRPVDEVRYLMNFNSGLLQRRQQECTNRACGSRSPVDAKLGAYPRRVLTNMKNASALTEKNKALTAQTIAFNYGAARRDRGRRRPNSSPNKVPANKDRRKRALRARLYHPELARPGLGSFRTSGE